MKYMKKERIAMFGGTFDPIHKGHINIMQHIHEQTGYTHIVCVPTSQNPDKRKPLASNIQRLEMLQIAVEGLPHVEVSDFEIKKQGISYTIDTVMMLQDRYDITEAIGIVIGSDLLHSILDWKDIKKMASCTELLVVPRPHYDFTAKIEEVKTIFACQVLENISMVDVESKKIRSAFDRHIDKIPAGIIPYIKQNNLYNCNKTLDYQLAHSQLLDMLQSMMSASRYEHSMRVAELSVYLANKWGESSESAWLAGVAHDCARELSRDEMYRLGKKSGEILRDIADNYLRYCMDNILYHGLAAISILDEQYPLSNEVYEAIATHTLGYAIPSNLQKIIYVADAMEPNRNIWDEKERRALLDTQTLDELVCAVIDKLGEIYCDVHEITLHMRKYIQEQI